MLPKTVTAERQGHGVRHREPAGHQGLKGRDVPAFDGLEDALHLPGPAGMGQEVPQGGVAREPEPGFCGLPYPVKEPQRPQDPGLAHFPFQDKGRARPRLLQHQHGAVWCSSDLAGVDVQKGATCALLQEELAQHTGLLVGRGGEGRPYRGQSPGVGKALAVPSGHLLPYLLCQLLPHLDGHLLKSYQSKGIPRMAVFERNGRS